MPDISKLIADFISISDSVIIPGFGKLSKDYLPAVLDRTANIIRPPHFFLNFDDAIQEDKSDSFLHYISNAEALSFETAAELLQKYKKNLLLKIFEQKEIYVPGLGTFYIESDSIKFKSESIDLNAATIDAVPINRKITKIEQAIKPKTNKSKVLVYRILIASIIVVSLVISMFVLTNKKKAEIVPKSGENNPVTIKTDSTVKADSIEHTEADTEPEKPESEIEIKSFLIAVGTYGGFENAAKIEKLLKRDGYKVLTKQFKSGKVRVSVVIEGQVSDLNNALKSIRLKYDKAAFVVE